jgi:asparagine synthase (glutamine-hydrolysing)
VNLNNNFINDQFQKSQNYNIKYSQKIELGYGVKLGIHSKYNNINSNNNNNYLKPFLILDNIALICNGEIYNYKELFDKININPVTNLSYEIIIYLYNLYGIEQTLTMLDGIFSFVIYDMKIIDQNSNKIYIVSDSLGLKPLYIFKSLNFKNKEYLYIISSELKVLNEFVNYFAQLNNEENIYNNSIENVKSGCYSLIEKQFTILSPWNETIKNKIYYFVNSNIAISHMQNSKSYLDWIINGIKINLYNTIKNYNIKNKNNINMYLSGDSNSLSLCCLLSNIFKKNPIKTFSIGIIDSENIKKSRHFSSILNTDHTEVLITETDIIDVIPFVIKSIETYDILCVREGILYFLLCKYIYKKDENFELFNGLGGYIINNDIDNDIDINNNDNDVFLSNNLNNIIYNYSNYVEKISNYFAFNPRSPFLDKNFLHFYLSIPYNTRKSLTNNYLLDKSNNLNFNNYISNNEYIKGIVEKFSETTESLYYKNIFKQYYPNLSLI